MLLEQEDVAGEFARRFANTQPWHRDGHALEWAHELSFNLDAIAKDSDLRARVTTWLGEPHAPEDLRIYGDSGQVVAEVQAKAVGAATQRLRELADDKYGGMTLLVPTDHMNSTTSLIDRRLTMPEGPLHVRYRSVEERLDDHINIGNVASEPATSDELRAISDDPAGYLDHLIGDNLLSQLGTAATATAATAAFAQGLSTVAVARLRSGSFDDVPWTEAARQAAMAAARAGVVARGAQAISLAAQGAVAEGATAVSLDALAGSTLPFALARSTWDLAVITHGAATGRVSPAQAGLAAAQTLTRNTAVWACAAAGQAVIPIPVVGALVGGLVGQYGAAMLIQGVRIAVTARDTAAQWDGEYEQLLRRTAEIQQASKSEIAMIRRQVDSYDSEFRNRVLPRLEKLTASLGTSTADHVLRNLAEVTTLYRGTPQFASMAEFDNLMLHEDFTLDLTTGRHRQGSPTLVLLPSEG